MRKSGVFVIYTGIALTLLAVIFIRSAIFEGEIERSLSGKAGIVRDLGLTDLSLFTEARYTRHISQADLHTAFQDHPFSMEHFPSGSIATPPEHLKMMRQTGKEGDR